VKSAIEAVKGMHWQIWATHSTVRENNSVGPSLSGRRLKIYAAIESPTAEWARKKLKEWRVM